VFQDLCNIPIMSSHMFISFAFVLASCLSTVMSQDAVESLVSRRFTEYLMPAAAETHEFARVPNTSFVLLSQMSNSQLVKIELDPDSLEPIALESFPMGNSNSGLHGVYPSQLYPGLMVSANRMKCPWNRLGRWKLS